MRGERLYVIPFESGNQTQLSGGAKPFDNKLVTFDAYEHSIFNNNVVGVDVSLTANGRLGHPLIRSITRYQHKTVIRGIFRGNEAHVLNTLQFFVNNTASPSGFGEGQASGDFTPTPCL